MERRKCALEDMELTSVPRFVEALRGRRVFVTGHTGFKGSWMVQLLSALGCEIFGYALSPATDPNLFELSSSKALLVTSTIGDVRDAYRLSAAIRDAKPDLVIHMAAQALVRRGYAQPMATWDTNVMGTVNLLEGLRASHDVRGVVVVTSDKCYENHNWEWGYRESDGLGGHDPYSASKAAAELVTQSYRRSFFANGGPLVASARAGNVVGGGDWSEDRLFADAARAVAAGTMMRIRSPSARRPWQHVLDCLSGYLCLASALLDGEASAATAFNFGPANNDNISVSEMLARLQRYWPELSWGVQADQSLLHEAALLYLDSSKARQQLGWVPRWSVDTALEKTAHWYRTIQGSPGQAPSLTVRQIEEYLA